MLVVDSEKDAVRAAAPDWLERHAGDEYGFDPRELDALKARIRTVLGLPYKAPD